MLDRARAMTTRRRTWHPWAWMSLFLCALLILVLLSRAAAASTPMQRKVIDEGRQDFEENCVACHATDGSGTGALSKHLIRPAKDLRTISERNGGTFPFWRVFEIISGERPVAGHETFQMPLYSQRMRGDDFKPGYLPTHVRILELTHYLKSIQAR
jgi:mono/diheme cytochrome c family protein